MKRIFKKVFSLLTVCLLTGMLTTSCNNGNDDYIIVNYDIATLDAVTSTGMVLSFRKINDSELVTLTTNQVPQDKPTVGKRYLIMYTTESGNPYESGPATLYYGLGYVYNGEITTGTPVTDDGTWTTKGQDLKSMWRAGKWINIITNATIGEVDPAKYELIVDESTLDNDIPEAYIVYEPDGSANATTREFYASFNISSVWDRPNVQGLRVNYMSFGGKMTVDFMKTALTPTY